MTKIPQIGQDREHAVIDQRIGAEAEAIPEFWFILQITHGYKVRLLN